MNHFSNQCSRNEETIKAALLYGQQCFLENEAFRWFFDYNHASEYALGLLLDIDCISVCNDYDAAMTVKFIHEMGNYTQF